jgi:Zn-dependent M28 family amino/carboxypeptidase
MSHLGGTITQRGNTMRLSAVAAALLATSGLAAAQQASSPISIDTLKTVDKELSSDAYEGRDPTAPVAAKTVAYIIAQMQAAGLKPGNHGQWTQAVPTVEYSAQNVSPLRFSGGKVPVSLNFRTDTVLGTYRVQPHVSLENSDVVFVGYGINAPEKHWNDYAGVDVHGKTVVILVNDPDWQTPTLDGPFGGRAMTYYGRWTYKFEEAARQGAAAAIIVHQTEPAAYPWAVVQSSWTGKQHELDTSGGHMDQSQAIGWIQLDAAQKLFASAGKDFAAMEAAAKQPGFRAVPLGLKASVSFDNQFRRQNSQNVIGVLPGKTHPDEVVMYTAHWDHLGHCDAVNGDGICNGAVDNASGVAGLIALAQAHAKAGPAARTLAFMSVTLEESGLLGSRWYAEHPIYPLAKTVGGVNMDSINVHGPTRDFVITGAGKSELEDMARPILAAQGRTLKPETNPERGGYYRSDHFSFAKLGVPMLDGGAGQDWVNGGVAAGHAAEEDYVAHRYHKPQDEYDASWEWTGAQQDLTAYYQLGRQLAEGSAWPNWYPTAEFRAARDKSRAGM